MARVFDENEDYNHMDSQKHKTGSKRDTFSPIDKIIANAYESIQRAERNKVKLELATIARFGGFGNAIIEVDNAQPNVDNIIYFYENGKRKALETPDVALVRAVNSVQQKSDGAWITKLFKASMGFIRAMYTTRNLTFMAGNPFRDMVDAYIHNQYSTMNPLTRLIDMWRMGIQGLRNHSLESYEYRAYGGTQSSFVSEDVDYTQRAINDITGKNKNIFSKVLDGLQRAAEISENITRLTTYAQSKKKLLESGKSATEAKKLAALEARDASVDFSKAGTSMRKVNQVVLFANAAVQGIALWGKDLSVDNLKSRKGMEDAAKILFPKVAKMLMASVLPGLLQFAWNYSDDDRWEKYKRRHDWEKETYWLFCLKSSDRIAFKIPKGLDFGLKLFSTLTDAFTTSLIAKEPFEAKRFAQTLRDAAPSLTATFLTPALEVGFNKSIFRDAPIVPYSEELQNLPEYKKYGPGNSPVAKKVGELINCSPRKIDYLINGYFSEWGKIFSGNMDELPIVRRFVFDPYKNPKIVKDYYEALNEQAVLENEYKDKKKKPDGYDPALHKRLKAAQETMRKLSKQERALLEDEKISSDERKKKLLALEKRRIALCERVFQKAR